MQLRRAFIFPEEKDGEGTIVGYASLCYKSLLQSRQGRNLKIHRPYLQLNNKLSKYSRVGNLSLFFSEKQLTYLLARAHSQQCEAEIEAQVHLRDGSQANLDGNPLIMLAAANPFLSCTTLPVHCIWSQGSGFLLVAGHTLYYWAKKIVK